MAANRTSVFRIVLAIALATALITLTSSCQGSRPIPLKPAEAPFVEAFLEYVGPPTRWAGPRTVSYRVLAREPEARAELRELAGAMNENPLPFTGCLYPVRARLVRADGSVLERQGCRGGTGWPIAAGRVVSSALETVRQERTAGSKTANLAGKKAWQLR